MYLVHRPQALLPSSSVFSAFPTIPKSQMRKLDILVLLISNYGNIFAVIFPPPRGMSVEWIRFYFFLDRIYRIMRIFSPAARLGLGLRPLKVRSWRLKAIAPQVDV